MFYSTSSTWFSGDQQRTEEVRREASTRVRTPEAEQQSDWLGWDGWVNPEPIQTVAQAMKESA